MNHTDIEHMAQGLPPSSIGKDHEEVVIFLAKSLLTAQQKLDAAIKRGDACMQAEIVWEKAMMAAIGEDGVGSVVRAIAELKAERDALAAENAALKSERAEMAAIGGLIRNQDNRSTDQPMFVVFEKREIIGSDEHSPSRIVWVWEGEEVSEIRAKRLEMLHHEFRDTRGYDRYAMQEIDVFVTACFTEQGCKDYLQRNGHNLRQPFIYAAGSYRNAEYQKVRKFIMEMHETPATEAALNTVRAEGVIMFASKQLASTSDLDSTITLERLMLDAEEFAGQLRAGQDGE